MSILIESDRIKETKKINKKFKIKEIYHVVSCSFLIKEIYHAISVQGIRR